MRFDFLYSNQLFGWPSTTASHFIPHAPIRCGVRGRCFRGRSRRDIGQEQ
jgi:hypothetical protein